MTDLYRLNHRWMTMPTARRCVHAVHLNEQCGQCARTVLVVEPEPKPIVAPIAAEVIASAVEAAASTQAKDDALAYRAEAPGPRLSPPSAPAVESVKPKAKR